MLRKSSDKIRHCYQHAALCREKAFQTPDPSLKADYLVMEERWVRLAQSYDLTESLSNFSTEVRRHLGQE